MVNKKISHPINIALSKTQGIKIRTLLTACVVFLFFTLTVNLINVHYTRDYRSDDVANQAIIQSLVQNNGGHGVFPIDTFIIHFPLYLLTDLLIQDNTRTKLFLQAYLLAAALLVCTFILFIYYVKKTNSYNKFSLITGTLIASFVFSTPLFAEFMLAINQRQLEAGLMLLLFIPAHLFLSAKKEYYTRKYGLYYILYILALGLLWCDDPYFMYIMAGGISLTVAIMWISKNISWQKLVIVTFVLLLSALTAKLFGIIFQQLGIYTLHNGNTVLLDSASIFMHAQNTLANFFMNFGGDLFGINPLSISKKILLPLVAGSVLSIVALASLIFSIRKFFDNTSTLRILLSTTTLSLILMYALTETASTVVARYFIVIPVLLLPIITEFIVHIYRSKVSRLAILFLVTISVGLTIMLLVNIYGATRGVLNRSTDAVNNVHFVTIDKIKEAGYKKGYANYWQAPINTYLSNGEVTSLPLLCLNGKNYKVHWLIDDTALAITAEKTFLIVDPSIRAWEICSIEQTKKQFGEPSRIIAFDNKSILLYDYDISSKMPDFYPNGSAN